MRTARKGSTGSVHVIGGWVGTAGTILLGLLVGFFAPHFSNLVVRTPGTPTAGRAFVLGLGIAVVLIVYLLLVRWPS